MTYEMKHPTETTPRSLSMLTAFAAVVATASGGCTTTRTVTMLSAPSAGESAQLGLRGGSEIDAHGDPAGSGRWVGPDGATIDDANIASVERTRRGRGALEGAGIGALAGAGAAAGLLAYGALTDDHGDKDDPMPKVIYISALLAIGVSVGAGIGAIAGAIRGHRDVEVVDSANVIGLPAPAGAMASYSWGF